MRSKTQTSILIFVGFLLLTGTFGAGFASAMVVNRHLNPRAEESETFDLFWEAWGFVEQDFYGDLPSDTDLTYGAIRGSLTSLDDPYSIFVEPQPREMERDDLRGSYGGIGAYVRQDETGQFVLEPIDEAQPSAVAGILAGDILLAIDGQPVTSDMTVEDVVIAIRGPVGEEVVLTIRHSGAQEPVDIPVERAIIELPSVFWRSLEEAPSIGYLQITRFTERSDEEVEQALTELTALGIDRLVLDLRHNGGGLLQAAVDIADQFLEEGVILYEKRAGQEETAMKAGRGGLAQDLPLVVLVDGATASASEIVAGALQDQGRATLIGDVTFGKGSVQHIYDLSDGSSLHVTSARWFTPRHQKLDGQGLTPELLVSLDESGNDVQLERAVGFLQTGL
jgi:carboxyl-terminal processing protease